MCVEMLVVYNLEKMDGVSESSRMEGFRSEKFNLQISQF